MAKKNVEMKLCLGCGGQVEAPADFCSKECMLNWAMEHREELIEDCEEKDRHGWDSLPPGEPCAYCGFVRPHHKIGFK